MQNKIVIVVSGMAGCGKSHFAKRLMNELQDKHVVRIIDIFSWTLFSKESVIAEINNCFAETPTSIILLEVHPPYIYDIRSADYDTLYIHLRLSHKNWVNNKPENKTCDILVGDMRYKQLINNCVNDESFYSGFAYCYQSICFRGEQKTLLFDSAIKAAEQVANYINQNITSTMNKRIEEFEEYAKRKITKYHPDYSVFDYQSFDYNSQVKSVGMSDPAYKWHNILGCKKFVYLNKSVLDIGSNIGEICYLLAQKGGEVYGIEYDKDFHDAALFLQDRFRKHKINFINADFMAYDFRRKFDYVFALAVLYLFYEQYSIEAVIKKVRSVTNYLFIGELTYNDDNRDRIIKALKDNFSRVEYIGDSIRTSQTKKERWSGDTPLSPSRQIWHCYV